MNLSRDLSDSLYSGGPNGHGRTYVSVHNNTLDPSSGLKHMAHFYQYEVHRVREWLKTDDEETI